MKDVAHDVINDSFGRTESGFVWNNFAGKEVNGMIIDFSRQFKGFGPAKGFKPSSRVLDRLDLP